MSSSFATTLADDPRRHVLGISGGKDSAALAIYIRDRYPDIHAKIEYFFSDTGVELPEVYEFLDKLEGYLGKPIARLSSERTFEHWLTVHNEYLPSAKQRWCTRVMKIHPFEAFVGDDKCISYVGIRADENREAYLSHKETISAVFPFIEDGIVRDDVFQMLEDSIGVPEYYKWRSRSGCYFCFFQRQDEWLGLKKNHPELYKKA
ncbi:phosphoadenosine phosphosulfate reductase family protein, partial [Halieaceae bacterium]|nr:phosphoadenosine phosphosulfate reductase family protein [Halieaceae bacterium]